MEFSINKYPLKEDHGVIFFLRGELSQWFTSPFQCGSYNFHNCEQYMMFRKAILFKDFDMSKAIYSEKSPKVVKQMGREIKGFDEKIWEINKRKVVFCGNFLKFSQNEDLWKILMMTGDYTLAEANSYDKIWGIGMSDTDENRHNKDLWGQNLLGLALMQVRNQLRMSNES